MKYLTASVAALGLMVATAAPLHAQVNAGNLVNVNLTNVDVLNNLAQDLDVNVQDLVDLGSVQVPIGIAANVCGIDANVLAQQKKTGGATCDAENSSDAFARVVQRSLNSANQ